MSWLTDEYVLTCNDTYVGTYYVYDDHTYSYSATHKEKKLENVKDLLTQKGLLKDYDSKKPIAAVESIKKEENRVRGRKRIIYKDGSLTLERIPRETGERFLVYRCGAKENEPGYSPKSHSAPHHEGPKTPEGMNEWTNWYAFVKFDDGTYEAALDESWWWGGDHNDGGTIHTDIPEEWFELPYDKFLENMVTLSAAAHYGFTPDELKEKKGLKEFFGF